MKYTITYLQELCDIVYDRSNWTHHHIMETAHKIRQMADEGYLPAFSAYVDCLFFYDEDEEETFKYLRRGAELGSNDCKWTLFHQDNHTDDEFFATAREYALLDVPDALQTYGVHLIESGRYEKAFHFLNRLYEIEYPLYYGGTQFQDEILKLFIEAPKEVREAFEKYSSKKLLDMLNATEDIIFKFNTEYSNEVLFDAHMYFHDGYIIPERLDCNYKHISGILEYLVKVRHYKPALMKYTGPYCNYDDEILQIGVQYEIPYYIAEKAIRDCESRINYKENFNKLVELSDAGVINATEFLASYYWDYYESERFNPEKAYFYAKKLALTGVEDVSLVIHNIIESLEQHNYKQQANEIKEIYHDYSRIQ